MLDAKRGDIGSTMEAYAAAYLDPSSPLFSDAVTRLAVPGSASCARRLRRRRTNGAGVFVLALTSNPKGAAGAARPHRLRRTAVRRG